MSVRFSGFDADYTNLSIVPAGTVLGEDTVPAGLVALVMDGDEVTYMEGTPDQIRKRLQWALDALNAHHPSR